MMAHVDENGCTTHCSICECDTWWMRSSVEHGTQFECAGCGTIFRALDCDPDETIPGKLLAVNYGFQTNRPIGIALFVFFLSGIVFGCAFMYMLTLIR